MAKPNYQFEKRQRDLAKKSKQDEKRRQKTAAANAAEGGDKSTSPEGVAPEADTTTGTPSAS